ncbi:sestrin-like protein [Achlya hypogyna]|uniref:Sestrin-like protein n=1 Tax=Achlya hypogyna TaxID=1202772 RepID=A0A1V9Z065_ACHHY|nr:sestrin-like protein [Achlya hypogyna]
MLSAMRSDSHFAVKKEWFFRRLLSSDPRQRSATMEKLREEAMAMEPTVLEAHLPTMCRLAREAPLQDIRAGCRALLNDIREQRGLQYKVKCTPENGDEPTDKDSDVSSFFRKSEVIGIVDNNDEELQAIFTRSFLQGGRVSHLTRMLAWHMPYLKLYRASITSIMLNDGPLPLEWRNYIALMAAAEYRCHYVSTIHQHYFLVNGGDPAWLDGLDYVPAKLARLHSLNALLAHQPWLITSDDVADLLASDSDGSSWSTSELVHAIIVMCMYHSMCSIALGLGVSDEEDLALLSSSSNPDSYIGAIARRCSIGKASECGSEFGSPEYDSARMEMEEAMLRQRLAKDAEFTASDDEDGPEDNESTDKDDDEDDDEQVEGHFEVAALPPSGRVRGLSSTAHLKGELWRYCSETFIEYVDFDVKSREYNVLHTEDFSWDEHCFSLVSRYFPGQGGQILEDLFKLTLKMTYHSYGASGDNQEPNELDTTPFRHAIWYYVHRIYGICHDDYDYKNVNIFLNRPTKQFVKKVACTPWRVTAKDIEHFNHTLTASEKCHVTLLTAEARKQAGLMYGLRAVMQHFL